jgi:hypothetical protein
MSQTRERLTHLPPKTAQIGLLLDAIRELLINTGEGLEEVIPAGRELSLALTKIEEATYWAIAGVVRHQDEVLS